MWQKKLFFIIMGLANALFLAVINFIISAVYVICLLFRGESIMTKNLEALSSSMGNIMNPIINELGMRKVLVIESRLTSQYEVLINSLWFALLAFVVYFVIFAILFLVIDVICWKKIRFPYYLPCFAFLIYMVYCFAGQMTFTIDPDFLFIVFFILVIISTMFIVNRQLLKNNVGK